jgi:MerR family transcriptional regulator, activator of bmr gene
MEGNLLTIGKMATATGMSVKALRFYERIGLLEPRAVDPRTRYRYYSIEQWMRLDIIKAARSMGMSLKELTPILQENGGKALAASLARQGERVAEKIKELQRTAASIDAARAAIADSLYAASERGVYVRDIPERRIVSRKISASPSVEEAAVGYSALVRAIGELRLVNKYETGILLAPDDESRFHASEVFNSVEAAPDSDPQRLSILPAGRYICVHYDGKNAVTQQARLWAHLRRRRLEPVMILQVDMLNDLLSMGAAQAELQVLASGDRPKGDREQAGIARARSDMNRRRRERRGARAERRRR